MSDDFGMYQQLVIKVVLLYDKTYSISTILLVLFTLKKQSILKKKCKTLWRKTRVPIALSFAFYKLLNNATIIYPQIGC